MSMVFIPMTYFSHARGLSVRGAVIDEENNLLNIVNVDDNYANDSDAEAGGIPVGGLYHDNGVVRIRRT